MQIINSEVRSISPQTPPAGLTEVSQKESSLGVSHWVSLLISDIYSLRKAFRNVQLQEGLIIRDEVFSLSKFAFCSNLLTELLTDEMPIRRLP